MIERIVFRDSAPQCYEVSVASRESSELIYGPDLMPAAMLDEMIAQRTDGALTREDALYRFVKWLSEEDGVADPGYTYKMRLMTHAETRQTLRSLARQMAYASLMDTPPLKQCRENLIEGAMAMVHLQTSESTK